jgi:hypothetical protein
MLLGVIGPAVVSTVAEIDRKVMTAASRTKELARFSRIRFKTVKVITDVKRHGNKNDG